MPRQIIDTESSRPQYVRRLVGMTVLLVLLIAIVGYAAFSLYEHRTHPQTVPAGAPRAAHPAPPGK